LLPVLIVLFLLSYGLMTTLIVEQGSTIETQRTLIRDLFHDSSELSAVKNKAVVDKNAADAKHRAQTQAPSASDQAPSNQSPADRSAANQNSANQPSSSQSASNPSATNQSASNPAASNQRRAGKKPQLAMPSRPAADLADDRRALVSI
jgi:hypothetical protein